MKWFNRISLLIITILLCSACDTFRPEYPATYTPLAPSQTHPIITLRPTFTPTSKPTVNTPTPRTPAVSIVWFANTADQTIIGIDPVSKRITNTIQLEGYPEDIVTGEGGIWVIIKNDAGDTNLLRIDPYSLLAGNYLSAMKGEATIIAAGEGSIWLGVAKGYAFNQAAGGSVEYSRNGSILQIDPNPSTINETYNISAVASDIYPEGNILWVLANRNTYSIINKIDLKKQSTTVLPEATQVTSDSQKFSHFTKLGSWLWMTPQETDSPYVFQVDSTTGLIHDKVRAGNRKQDNVVQITHDGTYLWTALHSGSLVKIDPETLEVVNTITTKASDLTDIIFSSSYIWAVDENSSQVFQIDPSNEEIVAEYSTGGIPAPKPTPTITPTINSALIWAMCGDSFQTSLQIGEQAIVNSKPPIPNRVREEAGGDYAILGYIQPGEVVKIVDGPICLNQWIWWKVSSLSTGLTGWTSEGDGTNFWLLPYDR